MKLNKAQTGDIGELVRISKAAFDSDTLVGASESGGPPDYDNKKWHITMMNEGHLFTATDGGKIVGGALLFTDSNDKTIMYVGRIFIDPTCFKKGCGIELMRLVEELNPEVSTWRLDTPIWNVRTNSFYTKLGYNETYRDDEFVYYQKIRNS